MVIIVIQSTIENLAAQTANLFLQNGYNHRSIHEKEVVMRKIILLHKQHGCDCYSPEIMALFLRDAERWGKEQDEMDVSQIEAVAEYRFELLCRLTQAIGETGEEFRFADFETDEECSMQSMADALAGE